MHGKRDTISFGGGEVKGRKNKKILNKINTDWMAADDRHNNQPKMFRRWQEEDGEEGCEGAGAGCQCAVSASEEEGER